MWGNEATHIYSSWMPAWVVNISDKSFQSWSATTVQWDHVAVSWRGACRSPQTPHICLSLGFKLARGNCRGVCSASLSLLFYIHTFISWAFCTWHKIKPWIRVWRAGAVEPPRVCPGAARKKQRRPSCEAAVRVAAGMAARLMSVCMFSQTLLIYSFLGGNRGSWVKVLHGNFPVREKPPKKTERDGGDGQTFPNLQQSQSSCLAVTTAPLECVFERVVGGIWRLLLLLQAYKKSCLWFPKSTSWRIDWRCNAKHLQESTKQQPGGRTGFPSTV